MDLSEPAESAADTLLVRESLAGNRGAFRDIVVRYQSLICALAYSGTGNVARSEDIAQETFVAAWRQLGTLRDPAALRSWLCGIARNVINNTRRRSARDPVEQAEPLESASAVPGADPSPPVAAMRADEAALIWDALARLPETYREPLVLYHREHRSVQQVAEALELSEDAVKQRLSRGRALLQEQVLALVEGALERTAPGRAFTQNVLSALPTGAAVFSAGIATTSSSQTSSALTKAGSTACSVGPFAAFLSGLAALGGYIGWQMAPSGSQSEAERRWLDRFWRSLTIGMVAFMAVAFTAAAIWDKSDTWVLPMLSHLLLATCAVIALPFAVWAWHNHQRVRAVRGPASRRSAAWLIGISLLGLVFVMTSAALLGFPATQVRWLVWLGFVLGLSGLAIGLLRRYERISSPPAATSAAARPRWRLCWIALATVGLALGFPLLLGGSKPEWIDMERVWQLLAAKPAQIYVSIYNDGHQSLTLVAEHAGVRKKYACRLTSADLVALRDHGVAFRVLRQGKEFEVLGWPGRLLFIPASVALSAGVIVLARAAFSWRRAKTITLAEAGSR